MRYCNKHSFPTRRSSDLSWNELTDKKATAKKLDGSYVLKTDRQDLTAGEIWRTYILLTRVEDAFRDIKSPLMERSEEHTSELQSLAYLVCRLLLEKKK